jgi:hypothetical protein
MTRVLRVIFGSTRRFLWISGSCTRPATKCCASSIRHCHRAQGANDTAVCSFPSAFVTSFPSAPTLSAIHVFRSCCRICLPLYDLAASLPRPVPLSHTCASTCASHVASELVDSHPAHSTSTRTLLCGHPHSRLGPVPTSLGAENTPQTTSSLFIVYPPRRQRRVERIAARAKYDLRLSSAECVCCPLPPPLAQAPVDLFKFERSSTRATSRESVPREKRQDLHNSGL